MSDRGFRWLSCTLGILCCGMVQGCGQDLGTSFEKLKLTAGGGPPQNAVLASDNANLPINLESNKDTTVYLIDGKEIGRGKYVPVWVADDRAHTITAKPENCDAKDEVIRPPYLRGTRIGFYYLRQDCPGECFPGMVCPSSKASPPPATNPRRPN